MPKQSLWLIPLAVSILAAIAHSLGKSLPVGFVTVKLVVTVFDTTSGDSRLLLATASAAILLLEAARVWLNQSCCEVS